MLLSPSMLGWQAYVLSGVYSTYIYISRLLNNVGAHEVLCHTKMFVSTCDFLVNCSTSCFCFYMEFLF
jgi:hypothetical protein